jgi:hypothetical protein
MASRKINLVSAQQIWAIAFSNITVNYYYWLSAMETVMFDNFQVEGHAFERYDLKVLPLLTLEGKTTVKQVNKADGTKGEENDRVVEVCMSTKAIAVINLFLQRGFQSCQIYQPRCNNRCVAMSNWVKQRVNSETKQVKLPMCDVISSTDAMHSFSAEPRISFWAYELEDAGVAEDVVHANQLLTTNAELYQVDSKGSAIPVGDPHRGMSELSGCHATALRVAEFEKCLNVFGYTRGQKGSSLAPEEERVDLGEIMSFFSLFEEWCVRWMQFCFTR